MSNKITKLSKFLKVTFQILFCLFIVIGVINVFPPIYVHLMFPDKLGTFEMIKQILMTLLCTGISLYLFLNLIKVLKNYQNAEYFAKENIVYYKKIGWTYLVSSLFWIFMIIKIIISIPAIITVEMVQPYLPLAKFMYSFLMIFNFSVFIIYTLILILLYWVMLEAIRIHQENIHTI
tara:strand:+ start:494 stop:1024 length:531 start_codon:yes stop_codon:yes gene_type:complete